MILVKVMFGLGKYILKNKLFSSGFDYIAKNT